ncbi:MAG: hypothetical protein LBK47_08290 [Prevotellaceae bacterium]|jgi:predicted permease|nr:hypothetical protein [Prevotellaceae bacterium]
MKKLDDLSNKKLPFSIPEGYFENLADRVMERVDEHQPIREQKRVRASSCLAFAAGLALLFGLSYVATRLIGKPENSSSAAVTTESEYGNISYYDLGVYAESRLVDAADMEQDDIVSYLQQENIAFLAMAY